MPWLVASSYFFKANSVAFSNLTLTLTLLPPSFTYKDPVIALSPCRKSRTITPSQGQLSSSLTPFKSPLIILIKKVLLIPFCHALSHLHDFYCLGCERPKGTRVCLHTTCILRIIFTLLVKTWVSLRFLQLQDSILRVWLGPLLQLKKLLTYGVPIPHNHSSYSPTWLTFSSSWPPLTLLILYCENPTHSVLILLCKAAQNGW